MNINKNLFDALPNWLFNCLASGSSNRIYSDCLLLIYHEYDREITYRIAPQPHPGMRLPSIFWKITLIIWTMR